MKRGKSLLIVNLIFILSGHVFGQHGWSSMYVRGDFNSNTNQAMVEDPDEAGEWFWPFKAASTDAQSYFEFSPNNTWGTGDYIGDFSATGDNEGLINGTMMYLGGVTHGNTYLITMNDNSSGSYDGDYDMVFIDTFGLIGAGWGSGPDQWSTVYQMTKAGDIFKYTINPGEDEVHFRLQPNETKTNRGTTWVYSSTLGSIQDLTLDTEETCGIGGETGTLHFNCTQFINYTIAVRPYDRMVFVNQGDDTSLPVQMADFEAVPDAAGVRINWWTASETNCAGFHIWRGETETGSYERVNTVLIPGRASASGMHEYTFIDVEADHGKTYWYKIEDVSMMGASQFYGPIQVEYTIDLPAEFTLSQNFPNPFNPETSVEIQIPKKTNLLVRVHDLLGNQVRTVVNDDREAGTYTLTWDGLDEQHSPVPSGIYFLRVEAETYRDIRKMTLIR